MKHKSEMAQRSPEAEDMSVERSGEIVTRHLEGNIIESTYRGRISFDGQVDRDLERLLRDHPGADWLVDAHMASGIDPRRSENAGKSIELFRSLGGGAVAAVITSGLVRMVASALSLGFDLDLRIFATREEALAHLKRVR